MADFLIGVDVGTTATKAGLFDAQGTQLAEANRPTELHWYGPDHCDQDPDDFYAGTLAAVRSCVESSGVDSSLVRGIGIAGQMAGVLGIDADGIASMPYDSWLDLRCREDVAFLNAEIGDEMVARTGCVPMVNHGAKMRWWRRHHPEVFRATAKFVVPSAYVGCRLAGLTAASSFIDRTHLHFTGVADARSGEWDSDLLAANGLPADKMPRIVDPSTVVGHLTDAAAEASGLQAGVPIAAGLGDTAAGALGAGIVHPGQLLDVAGSAAVFAASTADFQPDSANRTLIVMRGAVEDQWISLAYLSGGNLLAWFQTLTEATRDEDDDSDLKRTTMEADHVPAGAGGLVFVPFLDGRILPSESGQRGAWAGLNRLHRKPHLLRALLESVPYEYAGYLSIVRLLHPHLCSREVRVIGGGANSAVWNKIKASVLELPYVRLNRTEFGCWGAALVAGHGVGLFPDLAAASESSTCVKERYDPIPEDRPIYGRMVGIYRETVASLRGPSEALSEMQQQQGMNS